MSKICIVTGCGVNVSQGHYANHDGFCDWHFRLKQRLYGDGPQPMEFWFNSHPMPSARKIKRAIALIESIGGWIGWPDPLYGNVCLSEENCDDLLYNHARFLSKCYDVSAELIASYENYRERSCRCGFVETSGKPCKRKAGDSYIDIEKFTPGISDRCERHRQSPPADMLDTAFDLPRKAFGRDGFRRLYRDERQWCEARRRTCRICDCPIKADKWAGVTKTGHLFDSDECLQKLLRLDAVKHPPGTASTSTSISHLRRELEHAIKAAE